VKNGGLITKTINTPTTSSASGVWSLQEQYEAETNDAWPKYSLVDPLTNPQSFSLSNISSTPSNSISGAVTGNSHIYGFDPSGTYFFWAGYPSQNIRRLVASTPFDITTLSSDQSIPRSFSLYQYNVELSRDGTKIFSYGFNNSNHVYSSNLSTAWDLSTVGSWTGSGASLSSQNQNHIRFSFDGNKLYTTGFGSSSGIRQYTLSTPWDISTASYNSGIASGTTTEALFISGDGTDIVFTTSSGFQSVNLSTPWDISTASTQTTVLSSANAWGAYIDPSANIFVSYNRGNSTLYEYTI